MTFDLTINIPSLLTLFGTFAILIVKFSDMLNQIKYNKKHIDELVERLEKHAESNLKDIRDLEKADQELRIQLARYITKDI